MQLRMSCNKLKADVARRQQVHPGRPGVSPRHIPFKVGERDVAERLYYFWLGTNEVSSGHSQPGIWLACSGAVHLAFV